MSPNFMFQHTAIVSSNVVAENNHEHGVKVVCSSSTYESSVLNRCPLPLSQRKQLAVVAHQCDGVVGDALTERNIRRNADQLRNRRHIHLSILVETEGS